MADARLRIIIDALNKSSDDFKKLKKDIEGVDDAGKNAAVSTGKMDGGLTSLIATAAIATAAIGGTVLAMKQVYEAAREGADLMYLEDRFDNLTSSIQTTSDALMGDMREATQGMMSDAELMQSATDFMSLGLAKSHDEVVRLSSVAGQLGMNMNQLVLTLTNQTTMRFDALGVSVDGFDEKVKALEESGMSAQDAFTEAFLQQAEEQIERVGSAADSAAGDFMRLEAAAKNLKDEAVLLSSQAIRPLITDVKDVVMTLDDITQKLTGVKDTGIVDFFWDLNAALNPAYSALQNFDNVIGNIGEKSLREMIESIIEENRVLGIFKYSVDGVFGSLDMLSGLMQGKTIPEIMALRDAEEDVIVTSGNWADMAYEELTPSLETTTTAIEGVKDATNDADLAMRKYSEALLFKIATEEMSPEDAYALASAMGLIDEKTVFATEKLRLMREEEMAGIITTNELTDGILALQALDDTELHVWLMEHNVISGVEVIKGKLAEIERNIHIDTTVTYSTSGAGIPKGIMEYSRPTGGPVSAGNLYNWQEYGYRGEAFVPSQDGYVLSRSDAARIMQGGGGGADMAAIVSRIPTAQDIARAVRDAILMVN